MILKRPAPTTTTTTTTTGTRTVIPASAEDDFEGCFRDNKKGARDLPHRVGTKSYAECKSECSHYQFFGLQWHSICFCGDRRGSQGPSMNCKKDCSTTQNFQGDGGDANCVFRTGFTTTTTTKSTTPHPHSSGDFVGCWRLRKIVKNKWSKRLALPSKVASGSSGVSYKTCKARCSNKHKGTKKKEFIYFGRSGKNRCYCGREKQPYGPALSKNCTCEKEKNLTTNKLAVCVYEIKEIKDYCEPENHFFPWQSWITGCVFQ